MGVSYNRLRVRGAAKFENAGLYYGAAVTESSSCLGQEVFVVGGANSAGQAALHFAKYAAKVTLVVRASSLDAGMSHYLVHEIERTPLIDVRLNTQITELAGDVRAHSVKRVAASVGEGAMAVTLIHRYLGGA